MITFPYGKRGQLKGSNCCILAAILFQSAMYVIIQRCAPVTSSYRLVTGAPVFSGVYAAVCLVVYCGFSL
ncbi:hypothetical protein, partial [uncultured Paenalcaligenes sp.]|uniref:hypothetical protein n=1 Tax=uncultured Paenalcaligenes sp. TaxID=1588925 RepID=UPI002604D27B